MLRRNAEGWRTADRRTAGERLRASVISSVPLLLRESLAVTFIWFGGLKLAGQPTLPASLIAAITPSIDPGLSAPLIGALEVALGLGLLGGRRMAVFLSGAAIHLSGTFLVLVLRPDVAFMNGNPLLLSVEGEYVVKNLVLLAATASLAVQWFGMRPGECKRIGLRERRDADNATPRRDAA